MVQGKNFFFVWVGALLACMDKFFKSVYVLSASISKSVVLNSFDLFSFSSLKCAILLVMKSFNSFFFCSRASSSFLWD
jgi:hypothetical protein